jgi:hypothetical protein
MTFGAADVIEALITNPMIRSPLAHPILCWLVIGRRQPERTRRRPRPGFKALEDTINT